MPSPNSAIAAMGENPQVKTFVKACLIQATAQGMGSNATRDANIYKLQQDGYDAKRLVNMVYYKLLGDGNIFADSDINTVQSSVDNYWPQLFDVVLT
jgi:hypothetical protein